MRWGGRPAAGGELDAHSVAVGTGGRIVFQNGDVDALYGPKVRQQAACDAGGHVFDESGGLLHLAANEGVDGSVIDRAVKLVGDEGTAVGDDVEPQADGEVLSDEAFLLADAVAGVEAEAVEADGESVDAAGVAGRSSLAAGTGIVAVVAGFMFCGVEGVSVGRLTGNPVAVTGITVRPPVLSARPMDWPFRAKKKGTAVRLPPPCLIVRAVRACGRSGRRPIRTARRRSSCR